ncbi:MAG: RNA polymerase sigma factor, partial [Candidatus Dormibacteraceae bacterium]
MRKVGHGALGGYTNISSQSSAGERELERYEPGSDADFERLYRNTYRRILGTLVTVLGDRAAAEDCAQDTFERAYKG